MALDGQGRPLGETPRKRKRGTDEKEGGKRCTDLKKCPEMGKRRTERSCVCDRRENKVVRTVVGSQLVVNNDFSV